MTAALTVPMMLSSLSSCKNGGDPTVNTPTMNENAIDLSGFSIVRADVFSTEAAEMVIKVKSTIKEKTGADLPVKLDVDTTGTEKEIIIGNTNREASMASLKKLKEKTNKDAYIIEITDSNIVIVGTSEAATMRAMKVFLYDYVNISCEKNLLNIENGKVVAALYDPDKISVLSNGAELEIKVSPTTLLEANGAVKKFGQIMDIQMVHYPSIIELKYQQNPEDNGKLIVHFALGDTMKPSTHSCFMESNDGGKTWSLLARPEAQQSKELTPGSMSHLYELPEQIGEFPAGTLVYSSNSIDYSIRSEIWVWYSTDCGKTWNQTAKIANGGCVKPVPGWHEQSGVWEPFTYYDNGYLYCFYSDDSDLLHDQKIVYKRSSDGINWSEQVDVCTFDDPEARPGMFVMTKLDNGEYFMVYEYVKNPYKKDASIVYYKKTSDISNWNHTDPGTRITTPGGLGLEAAPSCVWTPTGSECGAIIVSSRTTMKDLFVSFDYGKTWSTFPNPLPWTPITGGKPGYSSSFVLGSDNRTVYYVSTTDIPGQNSCRIEFTSFVIY